MIDENKIVGDMENQYHVNTATNSMPTQECFEGHDYIALFFGANHCPFCKRLPPSVVAVKPVLEGKTCKVIFVSNDRDQANFDQSCAKVRRLDLMH